MDAFALLAGILISTLPHGKRESTKRGEGQTGGGKESFILHFKKETYSAFRCKVRVGEIDVMNNCKQWEVKNRQNILRRYTSL